MLPIPKLRYFRHVVRHKSLEQRRARLSRLLRVVSENDGKSIACVDGRFRPRLKTEIKLKLGMRTDNPSDRQSRSNRNATAKRKDKHEQNKRISTPELVSFFSGSM